MRYALVAVVLVGSGVPLWGDTRVNSNVRDILGDVGQARAYFGQATRKLKRLREELVAAGAPLPKRPVVGGSEAVDRLFSVVEKAAQQVSQEMQLFEEHVEEIRQNQGPLAPDGGTAPPQVDSDVDEESSEEEAYPPLTPLQLAGTLRTFRTLVQRCVAAKGGRPYLKQEVLSTLKCMTRQEATYEPQWYRTLLEAARSLDGAAPTLYEEIRNEINSAQNGRGTQ